MGCVCSAVFVVLMEMVGVALEMVGVAVPVVVTVVAVDGE